VKPVKSIHVYAQTYVLSVMSIPVSVRKIVIGDQREKQDHQDLMEIEVQPELQVLLEQMDVQFQKQVMLLI
jgi:hypothetical protein